MDKELKKRWKKVCSQIENSGLKKKFIASELNVADNTISQYTANIAGEPLHRNYVTESMTKRLEEFLNR